MIFDFNGVKLEYVFQLHTIKVKNHQMRSGTFLALITNIHVYTHMIFIFIFCIERMLRS